MLQHMPMYAYLPASHVEWAAWIKDTEVSILARMQDAS